MIVCRGSLIDNILKLRSIGTVVAVMSKDPNQLVGSLTRNDKIPLGIVPLAV